MGNTQNSITDEEIEHNLRRAKREDGTFDGNIIVAMNKKGIYFDFLSVGIRWRRVG